MSEKPSVTKPLYDQLLAYVRRRISPPADAEDLVQQILLRVINSEAPAGERFAPWLFRVARNAVVDAYRARGRGPTFASDELSYTSPSEGLDSDTHDTEAIARFVSELLGQLSENEREALEAVDRGGTSQREFADREGVPYATAKSRVQRARARLRRELERHCQLELDGRGVPTACRPRVADCCTGPTSGVSPR